MNPQDNTRTLTWGAVIGVILLAVGVAVGLSISRDAPQNSVPVDVSAAAAVNAATGAVTASVPNAGMGGTMLTVPDRSDAILPSGAASTAAMTADAPSVRVENGRVKFFFVSGKSELAQGAREALGAIVKGVAAGQSAVISSFHDASGDTTQTQALVQQRAMVVRDALISLGIGEDKLQLRSPEPIAVGKDGSHEAPQVEVGLQ